MRKVIAASAIWLLFASPAFANPQDFLNKALMGDNSETALGKMAMTRGLSSEVRRFGAMLATDHSNGRSKVVPLARRYHVPLTRALAPEVDAEQRKLSSLTGRNFDREFVRYMVEDHQTDIADFEGELRSRDPGDVKGLARKTLPVLNKHLMKAKSIRL